MEYRSGNLSLEGQKKDNTERAAGHEDSDSDCIILEVRPKDDAGKGSSSGTQAPPVTRSSGGRNFADDLRGAIERQVQASKAADERALSGTFTDVVEDQPEGRLMESIINGVEDFRAAVPATANHIRLLEWLLQPTRFHYAKFTGSSAPSTNHRASYLAQYQIIRADVMEWSIDHDCDDIHHDLVGLRSFTVNGFVWNQDPGEWYHEGRPRWRVLLYEVMDRLEEEERKKTLQ
ncbi:hypothetical protein MMC07_009185, partial [Pseudocyphellaria aurata]|nr:hypothetical protein [Pseudocyphellaria aurata]